MRILWTLFKLFLGLAVAIPVGIVILAVTAGVLGALFGLAVMALKLICVGFVAYGMFRLARHLFAPAPPPPAPRVFDHPSADPYYTAAIRELDAELGRSPRA